MFEKFNQKEANMLEIALVFPKLAFYSSLFEFNNSTPLMQTTTNWIFARPLMFMFKQEWK